MAAPPFDFDDAQKAVLAHPSGALLVTGGPGTGKTAVLRERFARLIEGGAEPERVVLVARLPRCPRRRTSRAPRAPAGLAARPAGADHPRARATASRTLPGAGDEPPEMLSAAEQFARVRELLAGQDPADWPAYGALLGCAGSPTRSASSCCGRRRRCCARTDIEQAAGGAGLAGWAELAAFDREYQQVLDDLNVVDFAGARAARGLGGRPADRPARPRARRRLPGHDAGGRGAARRARRARAWSSRATPTRTSSRSRARRACRWIGSLEAFPGADDDRAADRAPAPEPARDARRGSRRTPPRSTRRSRGSCAASTSRTASPGASWPWSCGARARTSATCCGRSTTRASRGRCPSAGCRSRRSPPPTRTCWRCDGSWPTRRGARS